MSSPATSSMYTVLNATPFERSATPEPTPIRYLHQQDANSRSLPGNVIMPRQRSAGIGGYSLAYSPSGIGGHVTGHRDMGIGKACLSDSPRIPSRSASPAVRTLASFKRVLSFGSLSSAKQQ
ncbi:hypothetical protein GGI15_003817 [Coemansia interrupta]|uniref:Uncharacterized protein n=1 Tax=Coemansia interrupta TaxID=1126814 RepID=A0A9W8LH01_9FUNG|nr:hypothetical protein GGI15_003817 [Coemansia interrupta]